MSAIPPPDPVAQAAAMAAAHAAMNRFTIEAWTLLVFVFLVTILRTYARAKAVGWRGLQADDYLIWVGVTFYAIETGLAYSVGVVSHGLANNDMTDNQRAALPADSEEYRLRVIGSKIHVSGWTSYSMLLWTLKTSLLMFYMRLTARLNRGYRIRIYIGLVFLIATWIIVVMTLFLACRPIYKYWQIFPDPGNVCHPAVSTQVIWTFLSCNVSTDLYLISIPIPMLWQSTLKPAKKVGLIILFSGGILVIICAILRSVLIATDPVNGAQLAGSWGVRETFVAVITTNLPMVFPLVKTILTPILGSLLTSVRSTSNKLDSTPKDTNTFGGGRNCWRGRGPPTANPITNVTFSESEERIVGEVHMQALKTGSESSYGNHPSSQNENTANYDKNNDPNNIRKCVEVTVVRNDLSPDEEDQPVRGSSVFITGPKRASFHVGNQVETWRVKPTLLQAKEIED